MPRTLFLGLDVGDGHLVRRWAADGELPHLQALIAQGAWGWLATPAETLHVSAWPSLYTGTHPGEHGVYYTFQPARGHQGARRFTGEQYARPTLWRIASGASKRCVVLDAPYTHPESDAGEAVFEWGTWAHYWKPSSSPEGLYKELSRTVGEYPLGLEANRIGLVSLEPQELLGKLTTSLAAKARAIRWMLERRPWDLGVSVFGETHLGTHYLWPGTLEPGAAAEAKPAELLALYKALDDAIGSVLEATDDDTAVYVVSGDGGGPNHSGWHLLPEVLRRLGYTKRPGEGDAPPGPPAETNDDAQGQRPRKKGGGLLSKLRGAIPEDLRQAVSRHLPSGVRDALMKRNRAAETDWARTQAYCLPTDLEGCVRFNVKGREPEGIVEPGEVDALAARLSASIERLVNPATGEPAAARVVRTKDAFPGDALDDLPDLIVVWDGRAPIASVRSDEVGTVEEPSPDERIGTHRPPGFVIARGPGLAPGSELQDADVLDFAPSVLGHLGVDAPAWMTGRAWTR